MIAKNNEQRQEEVVTRASLHEIGGRILAFKRLVHILKGKQEVGNKIEPSDLSTFKLQVSKLIEEDMSVLMGLVNNLVVEGEEMLSLLHDVASANKDDFDSIQIKCLEFLSSVNLED